MLTVAAFKCCVVMSLLGVQAFEESVYLLCLYCRGIPPFLRAATLASG